MRPEQIDERRTQAEGVLGLKRFLKFAQHGINSLTQAGDATPSKTVIVGQIAEALRKKGYTVDTGIGSSDFKLDLAVVNPQQSGRYMLGIICDGSGYYRLKTARDREVVQPSVLRMLGWRLVHIWSLDWLLHPDVVMKKLLDQLN